MYVAQSVKNPPANAGNMGSIPGSGNPLEKEMVTHYLTQYSCLGNPMDRAAWQATVLGSQELHLVTIDITYM